MLVGKYLHEGFAPKLGENGPMSRSIGWNDFLHHSVPDIIKRRNTMQKTGSSKKQVALITWTPDSIPSGCSRTSFEHKHSASMSTTIPLITFQALKTTTGMETTEMDRGHDELLYRTTVEAADLITLLDKNKPSANQQKPCFAVFTPICPHTENNDKKFQNYFQTFKEGFFDKFSEQSFDFGENENGDYIQLNGPLDQMSPEDPDGVHDPIGMVDVPYINSFNWVTLPSSADFDEADNTDKPVQLRRIPRLSTEDLENANIAFRNRLRSMKSFDVGAR